MDFYKNGLNEALVLLHIVCMYLSKIKAFQLLDLDPSKNYSNEEIKRAYKKKALECHPDKNNGNSDEFIKVKFAFEVLTSDTITPNYELIWKRVLNTLSEFMMKMILNYKNNLSNEFTDNFHDASDGSNTDIHIHLNVTLKELYFENGKKMKVKYKREDGEMDVHIVFLSFWDYSTQYVFEHKGDWNVFDGVYGNLIVYLDIKDCGPYVINSYIDKYDLIRTMSISISDYYLGIDTMIDHFHEEVPIQFNPLEDNVCSCIIKNKGLRKGNDSRGDLYIIFDIDLKHHNPDTIKNINLRDIFPTLV
uniref:J domain-containing protein n=1 Tax=viral metagenome TaxID=1070528 RepID=A0A6C0CV37_9ZZZZ